MKPTIIMIHTSAAAAGRRAGVTPSASIVSSAVPAAPTPMPISAKPAIESAAPAQARVASTATASTASALPAASTVMPPTIHGVRRPLPSERCPQPGRSVCNA